MTQESSAIRNWIYIGGVSFDRGPRPIGLSIIRVEAKNRTANLGLTVDRAFVAAGFPNVMTNHEIITTWPDIREPDLLEQLGILTGMGQPFDVSIWKHTRDVFDGDGVTTDFYIQRRAISPTVNLPAGVPATVFAEYATRVDLYDNPVGQLTAASATPYTAVHKTNANIDTGDPASGEAWIEDDGHDIGNGRIVARIRLDASAIPPAKKDILVVTYVPLYRMVVDAEAARSYAEKLVEPRGLKLVEV